MQRFIPLVLKLLRQKKSGFGILATVGLIATLLLSGGELGNLLKGEKKKTSKSKSYTPTVSLKPNSRYTCTVLRVYDGDTFKCRLEGGKEVKVRLIGVDTPESSKNIKAYRDAEKAKADINEVIELGKKAKEFTKSLLKKGTEVILETDAQPTDKYGQILAYVYLPDGKMLNLVLIEEGYATVYTIPPNVKYADEFKKAQRKAMKLKKGLWSEGMKER
ncbi:thermonuclease family protein [Aquifex sp.]